MTKQDEIRALRRRVAELTPKLLTAAEVVELRKAADRISTLYADIRAERC